MRGQCQKQRSMIDYSFHRTNTLICGLLHRFRHPYSFLPIPNANFHSSSRNSHSRHSSLPPIPPSLAASSNTFFFRWYAQKSTPSGDELEPEVGSTMRCLRYPSPFLSSCEYSNLTPVGGGGSEFVAKDATSFVGYGQTPTNTPVDLRLIEIERNMQVSCSRSFA